jgi:hypothetical protein
VKKTRRTKITKFANRNQKPQTKDKCWKTDLKDLMEKFTELWIFSSKLPLSQMKEKKTTS